MFLSTRIILTLIGVVSRKLLEPFHGSQLAAYGWVYSRFSFLNIWGIWDTGWYTGLAQSWYSASPQYENQANYAFFPLYPFLMKILGIIIGNHFFIAGIILSNVFLIIACIFLYKLVRLDSDNKTSLLSILFLFLFPTAFVFSGVLTESLFLALLVICFYYAKKNQWFYVGIFGFFLALTRSIGAFAVLPLLYEYLKNKKFKLSKINWDILFLILIPLGLFLFAYYNYRLTGDFLAFMHIQATWNRSLINPIMVLFNGLSSKDINAWFSAWLTLITLIFLTVFYKKIGFSYWLLGMYSIFIPLSTGWLSMSRYIVVIFPIYIILAKISVNRPQLCQALIICLALLQGFMMVFWANGFSLTV